MIVTRTRPPVGPDHDRVHRRVEQLMGLPISLALRGPQADDPSAEQAWQTVLAELREVDAVFSTYRSDSVISRLGRGELALADCPPEVAEVLALGEQAARDSAGAFSVRLPKPSTDRSGGLRLDPSGVVKGWAIERASRHLGSLDQLDYCLSAGGDMVCRVADPDRPPWRIGIEDPHQPSRVIATAPVRHGAVATSGGAHRGAHIVDARTGRTPVDIASVTVFADSLTTADIAATSAYALGPAAASWLRGRPDLSALIIWADASHTLVS